MFCLLCIGGNGGDWSQKNWLRLFKGVSLANINVYMYVERRLSSRSGVWRARAHAPSPQVGEEAPDSQTSQVWSALSCSISRICGLDSRPHYPLTPLILFSVSWVTNHHSPSGPTVPVRRTTMTALSSPVKSSIFTKPFAQNTAKRLITPQYYLLMRLCLPSYSGFHQPRNSPYLYLRP